MIQNHPYTRPIRATRISTSLYFPEPTSVQWEITLNVGDVARVVRDTQEYSAAREQRDNPGV